MSKWWLELSETMERELNGLQVGVYASGGAPFHHLALAALWGATPKPIRAEDINAGLLNTIDVLIFPGGGFTAMTGMLDPLGVDGATKVRNWVQKGGMYLGSCAGSFLPAHVGEAYWEAHEEARALHMVSACLANSSDSIFEGLSSPGVGVLNTRVTHKGHWLARGLPDTFEIVHYNGPLFDLNTQTESSSSLSQPEGIVRPITAGSSFTPSEGFMGSAPDETLLDHCIKKNAFNGIVSAFGEGQVVLFGSHPEFGFDAIQLGWKQAVSLLANALSFQAKKRKSASSPVTSELLDSANLLQNCTASFERIAASFTKLHMADTNDWLKADLPSFLGLNAQDLWLAATKRAAEAAENSAALSYTLSTKKLPESASVWLTNPALANQDVGFMGLKELLSNIEAQLELAQKQLQEQPIKLEHAYDGFGVHPYQIAASSYLSAAGLTAAAHLLIVTVAKLSQHDELIPFDLLLA